MISAAVLLLISGMGLYGIQRDSIEENGLRDTCESLVSAINELGSGSGELELYFTFQEKAEGIYLKPKFGGLWYLIRITSYYVFMAQNGRYACSRMISPVRLWQPEKVCYNHIEFEKLINEYSELVFNSRSGYRIFAERKQIQIDGIWGYDTFVYLE